MLALALGTEAGGRGAASAGDGGTGATSGLASASAAVFFLRCSGQYFGQRFGQRSDSIP